MAAPIAPRCRSIEIIKELIKAGDLGRLKRLIRDQRSLQNPERPPRERDVLGNGFQMMPNFGLNWLIFRPVNARFSVFT